MKSCRYTRFLVTLSLLLAAPLALADKAAANTPPPNVTVTYVNPQSFTEMRSAPGSMHNDVKDNLALLKRHIARRASAILAPGQHLSISITDVKLAGQYEPWNQASGGWMRIIKRPFAPRMELHFTLRNAEGKVIRQGKRTLLDAGFMDRVDLHDSNPVRYSQAMVDRWLRRGADKL